MASTGGFKPSNAPPIAETGMKGFFKWYAREQPGDYPRVARAAWSNAPEVFSDYTQSRAQVIRAKVGRDSLMLRTYNPSLGFLGDPTGVDAAVAQILVPGAGTDTGQLQALTEADLQPVNVAADDTTLSLANPTAITTSDAANAGRGTSTTTTSWLSNLINGASNLIMTQQQAQTARAITNLQLQRAQQGLAPLNIGMAANGVPVVGSSMFSSLGGSGIAVLALGALAAIFLFGRRRAA